MICKFKPSHSTKYRLQLSISAALLALASTPQQALSQDSGIDEIVVTGSFIRRTEGFKTASPLTQVNAEELSQFGTTSIGDVISSLNFNNGTPTSDNILAPTASVATSSSINLRGLGTNATLNLVDGLRVNGDNVNDFLPQIAIQRLDIVTDGAAALYGTAAVAGVVNFVPIKSYEGVKVEGFVQGDDRGDYEDNQISIIGGTEWNGFNMVGALEIRNNGNLEFLDRPEQFTRGLSSSSTGGPGRYNVPIRDANGNLTSRTRATADPGCGATYEDPTQRFNNKAGFLFAGNCWLEIGEWHDYRTAQDTATAYGNVSYDFSSDFSVALQASLFNRESYVRRSPTSSGGNIGGLPTIRGELPGNPFRAVNSAGQPLFAQDADGNGIPDRNSSNAVILDPNGIAFNEDVTFNRWRPITKHGTLSSALNSDGTRRDGNKVDGARVVLSTEFPVPVLSDWAGTSAVTHQTSDGVGPELNYSVSRIGEGLNCDVLGNRDRCFNPFYSSDTSTLNSQEFVDYITVVQNSKSESQLRTWDTVISGPIEPNGFQLPGGPIAAAIGHQWRQTSSDYSPTQLLADDDAFNGARAYPTSYNRNVRSAFVELSLPILENLELQVAVRREEYSSGQASTDPKYGFVYSPLDNLTIRGSAGTSFIVPSDAALTRPESCGLQGLEDRFSSFSAFVQTCATGNPLLKPETADTLSFGATWEPLQNLILDLDWSEVDFVDRIVSFSSADIMANDFANYVAAYGQPTTANGKPTAEQLATWVADPRSDQRVVRSVDDLSFLERVYTSSTNASSEFVRAIDLKARYLFTLNNLGDFNASINATYIDTHEVQLSQTSPKFESVGNQNSITGAVPPIPRWKGNAGLGWNRDNHSAYLTVRYTDGVKYDGPTYNFQVAWNPNWRLVDEIEADTTVDISYTYSNISLFGGDGAVTIGSRNLLDHMPTGLPQLGGVEPYISDPIGRMLYMRLTFKP